MHPIENQTGERHPFAAEAVHEEGRLAQRVRLRRGHDDEGGARRLQQLVGLVGSLAKTTEHRVQRADQGLHIAEHLGTEYAVEHGIHHVEADPHRA